MVEKFELTNGLTLLVEPIDNVQSVAYDLLIPGGVINDPPEHLGLTLILGELTSRGAGSLDSRQMSEAFENAGIRHGESGGHHRFTYRGSLLAENLPTALELVSLMVQQPKLPEEEIDNIRSVCLQEIVGLLDNPAQRVMSELCNRYYPQPYGRPGEGTETGLNSCDISVLRSEFERRFGPEGSILSIAGRVDPQEVQSHVERLFGSWAGSTVERPAFDQMPEHESFHIESESAQMQIALAYPSAKFIDEHYYTARVAAGILSGGMFGRMFVEVREKRGLCYSVYSRHSAGRECGAMLSYAGTTPERADETLMVMLQVLRELKGSIALDELERAKANILSGIVIGEESTSSRAVSNAGDQWLLGRVRDLDVIKEEVQKVTPEMIDNYLEAFPANSFMLQTLGSRKLELERYL